MPFANITNTTDNVGTYADAKGYFTLTSPDSVLNVQVRSVGFGNNNITLKHDLGVNNVVMKEDYSNLAEVVVSNNKNLNSKRAQNNTVVLEEPEPVDGWYNYDTYIANNLNMPENFRSKQTSGGEVEVSFEVDSNGEPINIRIEKSLCEVVIKKLSVSSKMALNSGARQRKTGEPLLLFLSKIVIKNGTYYNLSIWPGALFLLLPYLCSNQKIC